MRRGIPVWIILFIVYGVFLLWHTPLKSPLNKSEIEQFLAAGIAKGGDTWASPGGLDKFLSEDDGRPFYMVNLIVFKKQADYPENFDRSFRSVDDANSEYGRQVVRLLIERGSYPVLILSPLATLINGLTTEIGIIDNVSIVRYRSRRDLLEMISSPEFQRAEVHKWASVERTLVIPTTALAYFNLGLIVPLLLLGSGFVFIQIKSLRLRSRAGP